MKVLNAVVAGISISIVSCTGGSSTPPAHEDSTAAAPAARAALSRIPIEELYKVASDSAILTAARALMLADSNVALVTVDSSGQPRVRTVKAFVDRADPADPRKGVTVWIMTRLTTRKVDQIRGNPNVTLYFNNDAAIAYATVMGNAVVHTDPENADAKRFYDAEWAKFFWPEFPKGFVMIEVKPRWLEYLGPGMAGHPQTWRPQAVVFETAPQ